jgi:hypothetical protein
MTMSLPPPLHAALGSLRRAHPAQAPAPPASGRSAVLRPLRVLPTGEPEVR